MSKENYFEKNSSKKEPIKLENLSKKELEILKAILLKKRNKLRILISIINIMLFLIGIFLLVFLFIDGYKL